MTEVENLSGLTNPESADTGEIDVRKLIVQQLESLRMAGLTHLPAGQGAYSFDLPPSDSSGSPQSDAEATTISSRPTQPDVVKEPPQTSFPSQKSQLSETPKPAIPPPAPPTPVPSVVSNSDAEAYGPSLPLSDRKSALQVLQDEVAGCTRCEELSSQRTQTVFGVGNPAARLVFVGEGPGFHEDRLGVPFVGDAGEQLDKIIKACKLSREDVFILNAVKCRPPQNRNPAQTELANCWGYAERQLEILQPEFIVCLGSVAARTLLKTTQSLGRLRKQFHSYRGSRVLVTYHPAYLLRTPSAKRHVWDDMKMLMKEMGIDWTK